MQGTFLLPIAVPMAELVVEFQIKCSKKDIVKKVF